MKQLNEVNEVRAPDRCEGLLNDTWQGFQHLGKTETQQDKITKFWKVHTEEDVKNYLNVTTGVSEYLLFLVGQTWYLPLIWKLCLKINKEKARECVAEVWKQHDSSRQDFSDELFELLPGSKMRDVLRKFIPYETQALFNLKNTFFLLELVESTDPEDFYKICHVVDKKRTEETIHKNEYPWNTKSGIVKERILQKFILDSPPDQIHNFFDTMIVKMKWRRYMWNSWEHWIVVSENDRRFYFQSQETPSTHP
jgi:hypothetical protein